jgi:hypothetical protein
LGLRVRGSSSEEVTSKLGLSSSDFKGGYMMVKELSDGLGSVVKQHFCLGSHGLAGGRCLIIRKIGMKKKGVFFLKSRQC